MKNLKNISTAIFTAILFVTSVSAQTEKKAAEPFTVKYIGNEDNFLYFQVKVNTEGTNYSLFKISDNAEGELYSQSWKASDKTQVFKIEKLEGQQLNFRLLYGKKVYSKSFSATTSFTEKTTVNENDVVVL
jgi:hypothetical protein